MNVTVKDTAGKVVHTYTGSLDAGWGKFNWDGVGDDGKTYPEGRTWSSIDARDADGGYIPARTELGGIVKGVDLSGTEPVLLVGDARINLSMVTSVKAAGGRDDADPTTSRALLRRLDLVDSGDSRWCSPSMLTTFFCAR